MGWAPGENGRGRLNPFCVFIGGELFVDFCVKCKVVDVVLGGELFVPFGVVGVGGNIIFEECVVFEKNAGGFGVGAEGRSKSTSVRGCQGIQEARAPRRLRDSKRHHPKGFESPRAPKSSRVPIKQPRLQRKPRAPGPHELQGP